ncbi:MAG: hypothetical protein ACPLRA_06945, partial [Candidatus Saccharicenans sp.]
MPVNLRYSQPRLLLGRAILVLILFFSVLLVVGVFQSLFRKNQIPTALPPTGELALTFQQQFQALEFSGQKRRLSLKAQKFYLDQEQRQHLEGQVEITDEELPESVYLKAGRVLIDQQKQRLRAEAEVELRSGSLQVAAPALEYNFKDKVVSSEKVQFSRANLSFRAGKMVYDVSRQQGVLEERVEGKSLKPKTEFSFQASKIRLSQNGQEIQAEKLKLNTRGLAMLAQSGLVWLNQDESNFDSVELAGRAEIIWRSQKKEVELEEIKLSSEKLSLRTEGNTLVLSNQGEFKFQGVGKENQVRGEGQQLNLVITAEGEAARLIATNLSLYFLRPASEDFWLSGKETNYDLIGGCLDLSGRANLSFKNYQLKSDRLFFRLADRSFSASDFQLEIRPGFFSGQPLFFNPKASLFLTGENLTASGETFDFKGQIRIWQTEDFCLSQRGRLEQKSSRLQLEDLERASWHYLSADNQQKKMALRAQKVDLVPEEKKAKVEGAADLSLEDL